MAEIRLESVSKGWGDVYGVMDVSLDIHDEELVVFLGPSGCGKTTTMRLIAGLTDLTSGEVWIDGELVNEVDPRDRDVAMVFQSYALYPNMTIYENIRFPLRVRRVPRREQDTQVRRAAAMVEMEDLLDRKPSTLSGGQRQRAALARAIVRHPRVFLMDEPLSNLDAKLRSSMRVQLKQVQRQLKITTIYVTHDQIEAMTLADRIVIMDKGRIQQIGTPDEIYNDPQNIFVAGFIGSPPMNLIPGRLENGRFTAPGFDITGVLGTDNESVTLGVRPEDTAAASPGQAAHLQGMLYGLEPTGDQTFLTIQVPDATIEVKEDRDFRQPLDTEIRVAFDLSRIYLFDTPSGRRITA